MTSTNNKKISLYDFVYGEYSLIHNSWRPFFDEQEVESTLSSISQELEKQKDAGITISPTYTRVFEAFRETDFYDLKCIIIGQDPAPEPHLATGLSFSIDSHISTSNVPSIQRILIELFNEGYNVNILKGNLSKYAYEGVLLLNTVLTIPIPPGATSGTIDGHKNLWMPFTKLFLEYIDEYQRPVAFILWGSQAKALKNKYMKNPKHAEFCGGHPSPQAKSENFFCKGYFTGINDFLQKNNIETIDWNLTKKPVNITQKGIYHWSPSRKESIYIEPCS